VDRRPLRLLCKLTLARETVILCLNALLVLQCLPLIGCFEHDDNHIVYSNFNCFLVDPGIYFFDLVRTLDEVAPDEVWPLLPLSSLCCLPK